MLGLMTLDLASIRLLMFNICSHDLRVRVNQLVAPHQEGTEMRGSDEPPTASGAAMAAL